MKESEEISPQVVEFDDLRNRFLDLCEAMTGKREKLTFIEISSLLKEMISINPNHAVIVAFEFMAIYADAEREHGSKWWYYI